MELSTIIGMGTEASEVIKGQSAPISASDKVKEVLEVQETLIKSINNTDGKTVALIRAYLPIVRHVDADYLLKHNKSMIKASRATIRLAFNIANKLDDYGIVSIPNVATVATLHKVIQALATIKKSKPMQVDKVALITQQIFERYNCEGTTKADQRVKFETEVFKVINSRIKKYKEVKREEVQEKELVSGVTASEVNDIPQLVARIKGMYNNTGKKELLLSELQDMINALTKEVKAA